MVDIETLAQSIRKDSIAMQMRRKELSELKRPKDIPGLKKLHEEIQLYVGKNNAYQRAIDQVRHSNNDYGPRQGRDGDMMVRPAWLAKTGIKEFPWPFDQNLIEIIKIFQHSYSPVIQQMRTDLSTVAADIEQGLACIPPKRTIKKIRKEMSRLAENLRWLRESWRIPYLRETDSGGRESISYQDTSPGTYRLLEELGSQLTTAIDRQNKLEENFRGGDSNRIAKIAVGISIGSVVISIASLIVSIILQN